jgi:hypothetical protein
MFKLTSMSCSKSYLFEFVTSVNSHHVVFIFKFTSMSCLKPHLLEFVTSVNGCQFFFNVQVYINVMHKASSPLICYKC